MRKKWKETVGCHTNEMQILYIWFLCHKWKKKDEKWREINIITLAGPRVSFGELRLSTITAQSLPRNPELTKRKPGLSFLFFSSPSQSLTFSHPFPLLFLFLIVSCPFCPSLVCPLHRLFPRGYFQGSSNSLTSPWKTPSCCIEGLFQPVWG